VVLAPELEPLVLLRLLIEPLPVALPAVVPPGLAPSG
jgi:hypothetical protein